MQFGLVISCDNDSFQEDRMGEVVRILLDTAKRIQAGDDAGFYRTILDTNGNDVGRFKMTRGRFRLEEIR